MEPSVVEYVAATILVIALAGYAAWAWRIRKRIGSPSSDGPDDEDLKFHLRYPGGHGPEGHGPEGHGPEGMGGELPSG